MKQWIGNFFLTALILTAISLPANAAEGDISVGGKVLLRIRQPSGGLTVSQRADKITERLTSLLSESTLKPEDIKIAKINGEVALTVGREIIITVDKETAHFNKTTPSKLAEIWVKQLREVIPTVIIKTQDRPSL